MLPLPILSDGYLVHESKAGSTCAGCALPGEVKNRMSVHAWISDNEPNTFIITVPLFERLKCSRKSCSLDQILLIQETPA